GGKPHLPRKARQASSRYGKGLARTVSVTSGTTSPIGAGDGSHHPADIRMRQLPYQRPPPRKPDLAPGRVARLVIDLPTPLSHVRSGALGALAVTRLQRSSLFPELPRLDEAGVAGFDMDSWAGIFAPAHTPPAIVTQLNRELRKIIGDPDVKSKLGNVGFEAF